MVVISAYFSGSETGMMTLNRYRLRHRAKQGNRAARRVEKLLRKPDRLISLVLIGNNLVNILASALGTIVGMRLYGNAGVAIATGVLTFVVLVFAEVLPKTIAALYALDRLGPLPDSITPEITDARSFDKVVPLPPESVHQGAALEVKPLKWGNLTDLALSGRGGSRHGHADRPGVRGG